MPFTAWSSLCAPSGGCDGVWGSGGVGTGVGYGRAIWAGVGAGEGRGDVACSGGSHGRPRDVERGGGAGLMQHAPCTAAAQESWRTGPHLPTKNDPSA